jgi:hypothetical protein
MGWGAVNKLKKSSNWQLAIGNWPTNPKTS